jgi:hypothetical protein
MRIIGLVTLYVVSTLGITSCGGDPCSIRHVVTEQATGQKVDQLELDDGYVYSPLPAESLYAHEYTSGTEVRLCDVVSQLDGTHHYSVIATDVSGAPTEMRRLQFNGF